MPQRTLAAATSARPRRWDGRTGPGVECGRRGHAGTLRWRESGQGAVRSGGPLRLRRPEAGAGVASGAWRRLCQTRRSALHAFRRAGARGLASGVRRRRTRRARQPPATDSRGTFDRMTSATDVRPGRVLVTGGAGFIGTTLARPARRPGRVVGRARQPAPAGAPRLAAAGRPARLGRPARRRRHQRRRTSTPSSPTCVPTPSCTSPPRPAPRSRCRRAPVTAWSTSSAPPSCSTPSPARATCPAHFVLTSSRAVYGEGVWRNDDGSTFQPGLRTHAQLEAGQVGPRRRRRPRAQLRGRHPPATRSTSTAPPSSRRSRSSPRGPARTTPACRCCACRTSTARASRCPTPTPASSRSSRGWPARGVDPALRGRRHHPRLRLHRRRRERRSSRRSRTSRPTTCAPSTSAAAYGPRSATWPARSPATTRRPEPHVTGQYRDGDVRHASCTVEDTVRHLDWEPRWSLRDGVAGLQEWIATQLD